MIKIKFLPLLLLFVAPAYFVSSAQEPGSDCDSVIAKLETAKTEYEADHKEQKKTYENWSKYNKQLHSDSYGLTDQPLADSYNKCKSGEVERKDFCKGVIKKYDEISAKEIPAKEEYDAAKTKTNQSRVYYNALLTRANELGCNPKKK